MKIRNAVTKTLSGISIIAVVLLTTVLWLFTATIRIIAGMAGKIR